MKKVLLIAVIVLSIANMAKARPKIKFSRNHAENSQGQVRQAREASNYNTETARHQTRLPEQHIWQDADLKKINQFNFNKRDFDTFPNISNLTDYKIFKTVSNTPPTKKEILLVNVKIIAEAIEAQIVYPIYQIKSFLNPGQ
jgi:hypothetical protein